MNREQPHGSRTPAVPRQCTAHSKRSGERCRKPAMRGRTVCRAHGGATPRGIASPHFKHGRYSKDLPAQLASRYLEAREDPERLSLNDEIALVDMRISELLGISSGERAKQGIWQEMRQLIELRRRLVEAQADHEAAAQRTLTIEQGMAYAAALAEAVKRHVEDTATLQAISTELAAILEQ